MEPSSFSFLKSNFMCLFASRTDWGVSVNWKCQEEDLGTLPLKLFCIYGGRKGKCKCLFLLDLHFVSSSIVYPINSWKISANWLAMLSKAMKVSCRPISIPDNMEEGNKDRTILFMLYRQNRSNYSNLLKELEVVNYVILGNVVVVE